MRERLSVAERGRRMERIISQSRVCMVTTERERGVFFFSPKQPIAVQRDNDIIAAE